MVCFAPTQADLAPFDKAQSALARKALQGKAHAVREDGARTSWSTDRVFAALGLLPCVVALHQQQRLK
eukprot:4816021-Lingulodinium_polyedra.AAC.1